MIPKWKAAVSFDSAHDAYVVRVDQQGKILWRARGPVNEERMRAVQEAMSAV
jgi:hypothetical protein